jgi:pimeloyl-ACP methyl ester carboxylesterase
MSGLYLDRTDGPGSTVVFLHGLFFDRGLWDAVRARLAPRATIALDMPGHGLSRPLRSGEAPGDIADAVAEAVVGAGVTSAVWVGHSWGGATLARIVQRRPELVAAALYCNTPPRRFSGGRRIGFRSQQLMLATGFPAGAYGRIAAKSLFDPATITERPALIAEMGGRAKAMGRTQLRRSVQAAVLDNEDSVERIAATPVPFSVLAGTTDYVLADTPRERFGDRLVVAQRGHVSPLEDPSAIVAAIAGLDARLGERPGA